jgi:hypothetical protein
LIGTAGCIIYQLVTIHVLARKMTGWRHISAWLVVSGAFGFIILAVGVLAS